MCDSPVRLLVISDLHAHGGPDDDSAPSLLGYGGARSQANKMFDLCGSSVEEMGWSKVDAIICPGDIAHQADVTGLVNAWEDLNKLSVRLDAPLIATAGNHDYDSRGSGGPNPKASLMALSPLFPFEHPKASDDPQMRYFSQDYAVYDTDRINLVSLNSSSHHGYDADGHPEYHHGRLGDVAATRLPGTLSVSSLNKRANVLLTHHHVVQLPMIDTRERSQMLDAELLLRTLEESGVWLVVHGHKHRPWIHTAHGGGGAPYIFSASSFSVNNGGNNFGNAFRNQFHVIEIQNSEIAESLSLDIAAKVHSWSWTGLDGWRRAGANDGLPGECGLGWRTGPHRLSSQIERWLEAHPTNSASYQDLLEWEPRLDYLPPDDKQRVVEIMGSLDEPIRVSLDEAGRWLKIEKRILAEGVS
ncbi:hypothetical protein CH275_25700 [Rhodococcus sp. 06-235-1A]|uniref:metallophosphoesterase family protein n=1 Tax=Rhodococcus sp. 06-235-1A TaxID=2022508 RepID=UPI000B9BDC3C|nr:metallophosphoesterase [Rhodococcus sp. 06-235-1A]OZC97516.1 hypothetical protein CH275_25700 [Rhodococcus sp. 06-235-1A]